MKACKNCGRNFAEDRIEKHEEICLKTAAKKRKVFDMTKARVKGTDAAKYVRSSAHLKNIEAKVTFLIYNGITGYIKLVYFNLSSVVYLFDLK